MNYTGKNEFQVMSSATERRKYELFKRLVRKYVKGENEKVKEVLVVVKKKIKNMKKEKERRNKIRRTKRKVKEVEDNE